MMQKMGFLMLAVLLLVGACSNGKEITGAVVQEVGTLTVKVIHANGTIISNAEIYVNGVLKGKTNAYGESKGTKTVLLEGTKNEIRVKKSGYAASEPVFVSAAREGEQKVTVVLVKEAAAYELMVEDKNGEPVVGAEVRVQSEDSREYLLRTTNQQGGAYFEQVAEGEYIVRITKAGFYPREEQVELQEQEEVKDIVQLQLLPHLELEVVGPAGEPISQAEITLFEEAEFNTPGGTAFHVRLTSQQGKVFFDDVQLDETYVIIIKKEGWDAQTIEKEVTEEEQFQRIVLQAVE